MTKHRNKLLFLFGCIICLLLFLLQAYMYFYYVTIGSRKVAIAFLAAYYVVAFLYGHLFFGKDMGKAILFTIVAALVNLMGDYSKYSPVYGILHGLTSPKTAICAVVSPLLIYLLIRLFLWIGAKRHE